MSLFDTGIRPAVDEWLLAKSKEERNYGDYWSASSAGYCMRKVIFERLGVPKIESDGDARKQRVFTSGHLFHEWIQRITKEAGLSIAQEIELQDEELLIRGHIDDLVLFEFGDDKPMQHLVLYDYKTRNSRNFNYAKTMSHYHKMQLGTYMYMLRAMPATWIKTLDAKILTLGEQISNLSEARILNIEKDTLRMIETQLVWSAALEKEVYEYWSTLNGYWQSKKMPKCTCGDYEGGFLAKEQYNGYFYEGESCSLKYYNKCKKEGLLK